MKSEGGADIMYSSTILDLALDGSEWSASHPCHCTLEVQRLVPFGRRLSGPQGQSGRCGEKQICTAGNETQAIQPVIPTK